ncbi:MAG: histidine phosphatase family protein [Clostridia bacterium]|nr:histidine phosphatase family protein [Clostridia bacterium]
MIDVIFIRHGATAGNLLRRYVGRTDEPLCAEGIKQALSLKKEGFTPDHIFVSPMKRTYETAELIFPKRRFIMYEGFKETDFGIFEGKTARELECCPEYRAWVESGCLSDIPNGESVAHFKERCVKAFDEAIRSVPDGSSAAFVIHGGVIMAILEARATPKRDFYEYHIKNGEYIRGRYNGKTIVFL